MRRISFNLALLIIVGSAYGQNIEAPVVQTNVSAKFMKLNITNSWNSGEAKLVVPSSSNLPPGKSKVETIQIKYAQSGSRFPLAAIYDPFTKENCIVSGNQSFYISDSSGIIGCLLLGGELICRPSYFKRLSSSEDIGATIAQFTSEFDEKQLDQQESKSMFRVMLGVGAPFSFFTANSLGGSQPGTPTLKAIDLTDGILRLDLLSSGDKFNGSFWIDLKTKKMIKSVVDGQEMDLSTGKFFAVPLKPH